MPARNRDPDKPAEDESPNWSGKKVNMQTQDIGRLALRRIGQRLRVEDPALQAPLPLDIEQLLNRLDQCEHPRPTGVRRRHS